MNFSIEYEQEEDGRWLAEVPQLPGVLAYGASAEEAMAKAEVLALRVSGDKHYLRGGMSNWPSAKAAKSGSE